MVPRTGRRLQERARDNPTKGLLWFEDNEGCIAMSENLRSKTCSKHIDLRAWSRKEHVERGVLRLVSCPTEDMCAGGMAKGLTYKFAQHRDAGASAPHGSVVDGERRALAAGYCTGAAGQGVLPPCLLQLSEQEVARGSVGSKGLRRRWGTPTMALYIRLHRG